MPAYVSSKTGKTIHGSLFFLLALPPSQLYRMNFRNIFGVVALAACAAFPGAAFRKNHVVGVAIPDILAGDITVSCLLFCLLFLVYIPAS